MPSALTYPGVYVEEVPSGVRTITGVATSITAFIGRSSRGPVNRAVRVQSFTEYARIFGGLWRDSTMSYAVNHFFQHGGADALIVRVFNGNIATNTATITLPAGAGSLVLEAASPGLWGQALRARVDHLTRNPADTLLFNLTVEELDRVGGSQVVAAESFRNVSVSPLSPRFVNTVLNEQSALVRVRASAPQNASPNDPANPALPNVVAAGAANADGAAITDAQLVPTNATAIANREGMYALEAADLFNLLCLPPLTHEADVATATWALAATYTLKNSKRYRHNWGQQVRSQMGTAHEGPEQGIVRFRIEIAPSGTLARLDTLWTTSAEIEQRARTAIGQMPPLPPTPNGKPLIFEKTIVFNAWTAESPPLYKNDCLPDPPPRGNRFVWGGRSPQGPPADEPAPEKPDPQALADCLKQLPQDSIEAEAADDQRQQEQWGSQKLGR